MAKTAQADAAEAGDSVAQPPNKKKRLIIIGAAAMVVLAGGGAGFYFWSASRKATNVEPVAVQRAASYVELRDIVVSLAPHAGRAQDTPKILKLKLVIEVGNARIVPEIQQLQPRIEDILQIYLRELRVSDLEGSAGLYRLKEELLRRVNSAVYPRRVDAVLFKDITTQ
jgi:flagellar FliL protein